MTAARRALGLGATLALAVALCIALGGRSAARSVDVAPAPAPEGDCNPCPLSRVIVDQPAWDETVTVTDTPARTVHHHDLVTAEHTVAHTVLTTPAHYESYQLWVTSGYSTKHWIDTSHYEWQTHWVSSGYWNSYWVDTSHYETQSYYVSQGYWSWYYVDTGGYWNSRYQCIEDEGCELISYWQPSGYWAMQWIDTGYWTTYTSYVYSGYYASQWIDTSHYEYQWFWISSGYTNTYWLDTSHYETTYVWVASGYYEQHFVSTGGYWTTRTYCDSDGCEENDVFIATGYWSTDFWVDTSHYETRQRYVDDVYTTTYETIPAVYRDWDEQIAAVTHTAVVHHPAVTHLEPITLDQLTTQNRQSGAAASSGTTGGSDGRATAPTTIAVVSNITVVDTPAGTTTRTVVDRAAYDEPRTVVDRAAYDDSYNRPVWDYDCEDSCVRYIDYWETVSVHHDALTHLEYVHHDALTHSETLAVPAVTHQETLSYNATVADSAPSGSGGGDPLVDFVLLGGLMALAGAGKYASRADELKAVVANMARLGDPIPAALEPLLVDSSPATVAQVEAAVMDGVTQDEGDPSALSAQQTDTPPSESDAALTGGDGGDTPKDWWGQLLDNAKAKVQETAYAIAETGNTAAALTRLAAYDMAETGNTAAALAKTAAYDVAETGNTALGLARAGAYDLANSGNAALDLVEWALFGDKAHFDDYKTADGRNVTVVSESHSGVLGWLNETLLGHGNSVTLGPELIVSGQDQDAIKGGSWLLRHEGRHTVQATAITNFIEQVIPGPIGGILGDQAYLAFDALQYGAAFVEQTAKALGDQASANRASGDNVLGGWWLSNDEIGTAIHDAANATHDASVIEKDANRVAGDTNDQTTLPEGWSPVRDTPPASYESEPEPVAVTEPVDDLSFDASYFDA